MIFWESFCKRALSEMGFMLQKVENTWPKSCHNPPLSQGAAAISHRSHSLQSLNKQVSLGEEKEWKLAFESQTNCSDFLLYKI